MKALVTGGAGFIGSHVVDELLKRDLEIVIIDDLSGGYRCNVNKNAKFVQGSVEDQLLISELFDEHNFAYVYHLAAYAAEGLSHFIRHFNYVTNLIGSINLINASVSNDVKCFIFASSIAVYGKNQLPMQEDLKPSPEDPYGIAKYAVELDLRSAHDMFGLNYIIFRPHNVYGERQNIADRYRNVIGIFMNQIMNNIPMTIFGDGKQTRAFSYIGDVAPAIAESGLNPHAYNNIYNIGSEEVHSVKELAYIVAESFCVEPKIRFLAARNEVKHAYAAHDNLIHKLHYKSRVSLRDGVARMAKWAKKMGPRESHKMERIEIKKHLPSFWTDLKDE